MKTFAMRSAFMGFGDPTIDPTSLVLTPDQLKIATPATQVAPAPSIWDKINSDISNVVGIVTTVDKTVNALNPPSSSTPSSQVPPVQGSKTTTTTTGVIPPTGLSMGAKIGIGVGLLALTGGVIYMVTKKKK